MRILLTVALCICLCAGYVQAQERMTLKDERDKTSYSIGTDIGGSLRRQGFDLNVAALIQGVRDALTGTATLLTDEEIKNTLAAFQRRFMEQQIQRLKELSEKMKKEGEAFMEANKKKEGVVVLPSGLQYRIVKKGTGKAPATSDTITAHYRGTLVDGREFDSSYRRGEPTTFPVSGVIPGWTEALQLMPVGSTWQVFVPAHLAYGERGAGDMIPPNAALIFQIELISIK